MPTIDLTRRADEAELEYKAVLSEVPLESESTRYTGVIYSLDTRYDPAPSDIQY